MISHFRDARGPTILHGALYKFTVRGLWGDLLGQGGGKIISAESSIGAPLQQEAVVSVFGTEEIVRLLLHPGPET